MKQTDDQYAQETRSHSGVVGLRVVCVFGAAVLGLVLGALFTGFAGEAGAQPPARARSALSSSGTLLTITTTHSLEGVAGPSGWFLSPVTVTLHTTGDVPTATFYRTDERGWVTYTQPFVIAYDGVHRFDYYSEVGAESEPMRSAQVLIDSVPPASAVSALPAYVQSTSFIVAWTGNDNTGSGIASYDIQYRDSLSASWRGWITATTASSATFSSAQRGRVYYFRARASDVAGNVEAYPSGRGDAFTFVDSVTNGGFETGSFDGWTVTGEMSKSITLAILAGGAGQWSALLGSPAYGSSITPTAQLHVPTNTLASISQAIVVPPLVEMPAPALSLWYRMQTYDVVWGCSSPDELYDSFDVTLRDTRGRELAMPVRDGNYNCHEYQTFPDWAKPLVDITAQKFIDLSPYAGQTIVVEMHNANRRDWNYNTWTYVDDVRLVNQPMWSHRLYLPTIGLDNRMIVPQAAPPAWGASRR